MEKQKTEGRREKVQECSRKASAGDEKRSRSRGRDKEETCPGSRWLNI